jgi:uncharacterized tellurite resistance protein B-like protein
VRLIESKIELLADLFLGAAYSDDKVTTDERTFVRRLLAELLCVQKIPYYLNRRIDSFDHKNFDLRAAAKAFIAEPPMSKRRLLELVAQVNHSDGVLDFAEDEYLRDLAKALGVPAADYRDLVLEYEIERLRDSFHRIVGLPPPPPKEAKTHGSR